MAGKKILYHDRVIFKIIGGRSLPVYPRSAKNVFHICPHCYYTEKKVVRSLAKCDMFLCPSVTDHKCVCQAHTKMVMRNARSKRKRSDSISARENIARISKKKKDNSVTVDIESLIEPPPLISEFDAPDSQDGVDVDDTSNDEPPPLISEFDAPDSQDGVDVDDTSNDDPLVDRYVEFLSKARPFALGGMVSEISRGMTYALPHYNGDENESLETRIYHHVNRVRVEFVKDGCEYTDIVDICDCEDHNQVQLR
eukprot:795659_1